MLPEDLKQNLFVVMGSLFHDARNYLDKQFKTYGLTRPEWLIIALLRVNPQGLSQAFAKSYIGLETSYFTKVLNNLEEKGFIQRQIDPQDRRNRIIKLNPKSTQQTKKMFKVISDLNTTIQSDLNQQQLQELHSALASIAKQLEQFK